MRGRLTLVMIAMLFGASSSLAQEVGDEKEPTLRAELLRLVKEDQEIRGEFNKFRREHGLFGIDNKRLNEKLNNDPALKKEFLALALRMQELDDSRLIRMKEIVAKYGWPGRSLVGTEAATATYLIVSHAVRDVAFQKLALEAMKKLPQCEVEHTHLASLTDRVLINEGKKQLYGEMILVKPDGTFTPYPIEDEANVDKRRAELGYNRWPSTFADPIKQSLVSSCGAAEQIGHESRSIGSLISRSMRDSSARDDCGSLDGSTMERALALLANIAAPTASPPPKNLRRSILTVESLPFVC